MKLMLIVRVILMITFTQSFNAWAEEARPLQTDVVTEAQVHRLSQELRCLVCQNQTLADSHAELAQDLMQEIREMAAKGMTDQAIIDYLVARYGDFVRYRPPMKSSTYLLWLGPFVLLIFGAIGLVMMLRRREQMPADKPISPTEARKVRELLNKE